MPALPLRLLLVPLALTPLGGPALAQTPGSARNQTLLVTSFVTGTASVSLNGKKVGDFGSTMKLDVSNYVKPGPNTLRAVTSDANPLGTVAVSYAAKPNQFRKLAEIEFSPVKPGKPDRTVTFTLPAKSAAAAPPTPAASSPAASGAYRRYRDAALPFSAEFPAGWFLARTSTGEAAGVGATNSSDASRPRSVIQMQAVKVTGARPAMSAVARGFERGVSGLGLTGLKLEAERRIECNGLSGLERRYSYRLGGQALESRVWLLVSDRYVYSFSLISPPHLFEGHNPVFRRVLQSVLLT